MNRPVDYLFRVVYTERMKQISDEYCSTTEASMIAGITAKHIVRLALRGSIDGEKVGRNWLISKISAQNFKRHPTMGRPKTS